MRGEGNNRLNSCLPHFFFVYLSINKKGYIMVDFTQEDFVTGFFTDYLTGEECATVKRNGEEICITADEAYDILADQSKRQSEEQFWDCY